MCRMWCADNDVSNSGSKSCGGGSRDKIDLCLLWQSHFLQVTLSSDRAAFSSYRLYLSRWSCSSRRKVCISLIPVLSTYKVWQIAVNPSVTIYMYVPFSPYLSSCLIRSGWLYRGKDKVESMLLSYSAGDWRYEEAGGWWADEELLKYGLPTDIWFHVE